LKNEEVNGLDFFNLTKEKLKCHEMKMRSVTRFVKFIKECKEKKKRAFSTYHSLKEMLVKYDIKSSSIPYKKKSSNFYTILYRNHAIFAIFKTKTTIQLL